MTAAPPRTRRDVLSLATTATVACGAACACVPFALSLSPRGDAPDSAPVDVDLSKIAPGAQITASWRSLPITIIHRTVQTISALKTPDQPLRDPDSHVHQQPDYARNWHRSLRPEFGVYVAVCTHLGCIPALDDDGYTCPCHGSGFDLAGRVLVNQPAPYNLPVPPHDFASATTLRLGINPDGHTFDLSGIVQL